MLTDVAEHGGVEHSVVELHDVAEHTQCGSPGEHGPGEADQPGRAAVKRDSESEQYPDGGHVCDLPEYDFSEEPPVVGSDGCPDSVAESGEYQQPERAQRGDKRPGEQPTRTGDGSGEH